MAFIGFEEDYEDYKKEEQAKKDVKQKTEINLIAYENMEPITDEDLQLLKTAIPRHDPLEVYMQSDPSFYDSFYNTGNHEDPLLQEARNIRRIYKNIPDYRYAVYIREIYIEDLVEKYGGEEKYEIFLSAGKVTEWIPPRPVLSKDTPGYDDFMKGIVDNDINDWDPDAMYAITQEYLEHMDLDKIDIVGGVETRTNVLMVGEKVGENSVQRKIQVGGSNSKINGVDSNDINQLQQMFRSWYQEDKPVKKVESPGNDFFRNTPDKIKERYYTEAEVDPISISDSDFQSILEGTYYSRDNQDMDEMVIDSKTNLPMTRGELRKREFIRKMDELGYHDVQLMRRFSVGSEYELRLLDKKRNRRKLSRKKAASIMDDMLGTDISTISSVDQLGDFLFDD